MLVLDTHALIFAGVAPTRLSARARRAIESGTRSGSLAVSDISLWETAMLIAKGRLDLPVEAAGNATQFIEDLLTARSVEVLPITPEIAVLSQSGAFVHGDPADRLIAATSIVHRARLVSGDQVLRRMKQLDIVW